MTPADQKLVDKIQKHNSSDLITLWDKVRSKTSRGWAAGKALEHLVLRAFELEGALIRWPYNVRESIDNKLVTLEQIDGAIHLTAPSLSILAEFKDTDKVNIVPAAKLRNQLLRRPSPVIGCLFTTGEFTEPAMQLVKYLGQDCILLWNGDTIDFCLRKQCFVKALVLMYRKYIEQGATYYDVTTDIP